MSNFNSILKKERLKKGLTQKYLADLLGVDRTSISKYENGKQLPELPILEKLAQYFEVSTDYLLGREEINPKIINNSNKDVEEILENTMNDILNQEGLMLNGEILNDNDLILLKKAIKTWIEYTKNMKTK